MSPYSRQPCKRASRMSRRKSGRLPRMGAPFGPGGLLFAGATLTTASIMTSAPAKRQRVLVRARAMSYGPRLMAGALAQRMLDAYGGGHRARSAQTAVGPVTQWGGPLARERPRPGGG